MFDLITYVPRVDVPVFCLRAITLVVTLPRAGWKMTKLCATKRAAFGEFRSQSGSCRG
jgi:hypothetical protein